MRRRCPNCKSFNVRRSSHEPDDASEPLLRSPYRCRDCHTKFWAISSKVYKRAALILALTVAVFGVVSWLLMVPADTPRFETPRKSSRWLETPRDTAITASLSVARAVWRKV